MRFNFRDVSSSFFRLLRRSGISPGLAAAIISFSGYLTVKKRLSRGERGEVSKRGGDADPWLERLYQDVIVSIVHGTLLSALMKLRNDYAVRLGSSPRKSVMLTLLSADTAARAARYHMISGAAEKRKTIEELTPREQKALATTNALISAVHGTVRAELVFILSRVILEAARSRAIRISQLRGITAPRGMRGLLFLIQALDMVLKSKGPVTAASIFLDYEMNKRTYDDVALRAKALRKSRQRKKRNSR